MDKILYFSFFVFELNICFMFSPVKNDVNRLQFLMQTLFGYN